MSIKKHGRPRKDQPKGRSPKVSAVISPDDLEVITSEATATQRNVSDIIRDAIAFYVSKKREIFIDGANTSA